MLDYSNYYSTRDERLRHKAEKNFEVHYNNGDEGYIVEVNNDYKKQVIVKAHSNPMVEYLDDMKMYYVNDKKHNIRWGDEISGYDDGDGHKYLVITRPESNGVTSKCRIRKMYDTIRFNIGEYCYNYDCIMAKGLLYTNSSYSNAKEVFTDEDMIAIIVRFDENTSKLKMFDKIWFDGNTLYKIVKIDNYTLKEELENFGILQIVLIKTVFGELEDNRFNTDPFVFDGILRYAQLKERVYNSKARELLTHHDVVKAGDYIKHTFPRNPFSNDDKICEHDYTESRMYMVYSQVDMRNEYDSCFIINCPVTFYIKDDNGNPFPVYAYFDSNASQLQANERNNFMYNQTSKLMLYCQYNKFTRKLGKEITRIIISDNSYNEPILSCYEIVGTDPYTYRGCLRVELNESKVNPTIDNLELLIADYYKDNYEKLDSNNDFDDIYNDINSWAKLSGYDEITLGETTSFSVFYEPKIVESETHNISPDFVEFYVTGDNGNDLPDGITYTVVDDTINVYCIDKMALIGKKINILTKVYFKEEKYDADNDMNITEYHISELTNTYSVSGW